MGLCIKEEKTKCMEPSRKNTDQLNLNVENMSFEQVNDFKYVGINIEQK